MHCFAGRLIFWMAVNAEAAVEFKKDLDNNSGCVNCQSGIVTKQCKT
jgi:hypothetical protein